MIRRFLLFACLAACAAVSFASPAFSTERLTIERTVADREAIAVPWTDVAAAVVPDTIQVDTPMKLDAFGSVYFRTNDINVPSPDVECYQHIDPGRSFA